MTFRAAGRLPSVYPAMAVRNVDFTAASTDNALIWQIPVPSRYIVRRMLARRVSGAFGIACLGGLFTATSRGGNAIVAATQTFAGLTGAGLVVDATLAAIAATTVVTASTLYFNLATGNTGALVGDVYIYIDVLDA